MRSDCRLRLNSEGLRKLYLEDELSSTDIGQLYKVSNSVVLERLGEYGIPRRNKIEQGKLRFRKKGNPFEGLVGSKHGRWKGGRFQKADGYIYVRKQGRYKREHILIWEQVHNQLLPKGWTVHHINGVKSDNRPENLIALPSRKHSLVLEVKAKRIRELEAKIKLLERTLDEQQLIWWSEN